MVSWPLPAGSPFPKSCVTKQPILSDGCFIIDVFMVKPYIIKSWARRALKSKPLNFASHSSDHNVHGMSRAFWCGSVSGHWYMSCITCEWKDCTSGRLLGGFQAVFVRPSVNLYYVRGIALLQAAPPHSRLYRSSWSESASQISLKETKSSFLQTRRHCHNQ